MSRELDKRDFAIREIGCIACHLEGRGFTGCEKHHLNEGDQPGRKRRGEHFTVGLCQWHHRGVTPYALTIESCRRTYGPSWFHHKRDFINRYGDGDTILAEQNKRVAAWQGSIVTGWAA